MGGKDSQCHAGIRNIHQSAHVALDWRTAQHEVDLVIVVAVPPQILDAPEGGLAVGDGGIHVVLFPVLVDAEALEGEIAAGAVMGLDGPREEERGSHIEILDAVLHDGELEGDDAGHFDGAAEGDFAVALGEVEVADGEFGAGDVHGEEDAGAAGEVLDVAVAAVFGAAGDGAGALPADFVFDGAGGGAGVDVLGFGGLGDDAVEGGGGDQFGFAAVPFRQDFGAGGTTDDSRVDEAGEADVGDVAGGAEDAFEVPDRWWWVSGMNSHAFMVLAFHEFLTFCAAEGRGSVMVDFLKIRKTQGDECLRIGVNLIQEATAVVSVENSGKAPWLLLEWLYILDLDDEDISRHGIFHLEWPRQIMDLGQVDAQHVVCTIVVSNLPSGPVYALNLDDLAILDLRREGNCTAKSIAFLTNIQRSMLAVRMPSVLRNVSGHEVFLQQGIDLRAIQFAGRRASSGRPSWPTGFR